MGKKDKKRNKELQESVYELRGKLINLYLEGDTSKSREEIKELREEIFALTGPHTADERWYCLHGGADIRVKGEDSEEFKAAQDKLKQVLYDEEAAEEFEKTGTSWRHIPNEERRYIFAGEIDQHAPGAKLDAGKPRPGLVLKGFRRALMEVAKVGTMGARKYSDNGWEHVPDGFNRYTDAMWRHLLEEGLDEESGLPHLAHAAWNILAVLELMVREDEEE